MAQYEVLRPIELNGKLYLRVNDAVLEKVKSCGNGRDISVDVGGVIELSESQAAELILGQVEPVKVISPKTKDGRK
ncbi:MAG: hypothetical protein ACRD22_06580 [Terriglobia bacterium]